MNIKRLNPNGIDPNEVQGIEACSRLLPRDWLGYANMELRSANPKARENELDLVIITDDRALLIDFKNWRGQLENYDGQWVLRGSPRGPSAILTLIKNGKKLFSLMEKELSVWPIPSTQELIVFLHPDIDFSRLAPNEREKCFKLPDFVRTFGDPRHYQAYFKGLPIRERKNPLWQSRRNFDDFFRIGKNFEPQKLWFGGAYPLQGHAEYRHPKGIYEEYAVARADSPDLKALLRLWDFGALPAAASSPDVRASIAKREFGVIAHVEVRDRRLAEEGLPRPITIDEDITLRYWELFKRTETMARLRTALLEAQLGSRERLLYAQTLLSRVAALHAVGVAHTDLTEDNVWLDRYNNSIMLSGLGAAYFPETSSLGHLRQHLWTEDVLAPEAATPGAEQDPFRVDVFLSAALCFKILTGKTLEQVEHVPIVVPEDLEHNDIPQALRDWFQRALEVDAKMRFETGESALRAFHAAIAPQEEPRPTLPAEYFTDRDPFEKYPVSKMLGVGRARKWKSGDGPVGTFVKYWPVDAKRNDGMVLSVRALMERAVLLYSEQPEWFPRLEDFGYNDAGVFVAQEFVSENLSTGAVVEREILDIAAGLIAAIDALHSAGLVHGDLKPEHIGLVRSGDRLTVKLFDLFELISEGLTPANSLYGPTTGDPACDDRRAVAAIIADLDRGLFLTGGSEIGTIIEAAKQCMRSTDGMYNLASIRVEVDRHVRASRKRARYRLFHPSPYKEGLIEQDCGVYHVLRDPQGKVAIIGENDDVRINDTPGQTWSIEIRPATRATLQWAASSPWKITQQIEVVRARDVDVGALRELVALAPERVEPMVTAPAPAQSQIGSTAASAPLGQATTRDIESIDVPGLWAAFMDVEASLRPEIRLVADASYDETQDGYVLEFVETKFAGRSALSRAEGTAVLWHDERKVGELDLKTLANGRAVARRVKRPIALRKGAVLRVDGVESIESLRRRSTAVARILGRASEIDDLVDYFNGSVSVPESDGTYDKLSGLESYGLNSGQLQAFHVLWNSRPFGILQGPPGTGKTRFITSLVHYALQTGAIKNALVLSQSNEAADAAAMTLRRVTSEQRKDVSMLRVGPVERMREAMISLHANALQGAYREMFLSGEAERVIQLGMRLSLSRQFTETAYRSDRRVLELIRRARDGRSAAPAGPLLTALDDEALNEFANQLNIEPSTAIKDLPQVVFIALVQSHRIPNVDSAMRYFGLLRTSELWTSTLNGSFRTLEPFFARTRQVVCGTCVGIGRRQLDVARNRYDLVVIDEAARCGPGELAVAMQSASWVVLVGDHRQLPPYNDRVIAKGVADRLGIPLEDVLHQSDFERAFNSSYGQRVRQTLTEQYRMLPAIRRIISSVFYPDVELTDGRVAQHERLDNLPEPFTTPVVWYDTSAFGTDGFEERVDRYDLINRAEARSILYLLRLLQSAPEAWCSEGGDESIGVICMYSEQRNYVQELLVSSGLPEWLWRRIKVETVDAYQGQENDIVLMSLVRNNERGELGFVDNPERLNVALSRAKDRLVILGSTSFIEAPGLSRSNLRQVLNAVREGDGCKVVPAEVRSR